MNNSTRYSDSFEEDRLFYMVTPHYNELQEKVALSLREHLKSTSSTDLKVLELGCGTGITTQKILEINPGVSLCAIDNDEEVLTLAQDRLAEYEKNGRLKIESSDIYEYLKSKQNKLFDVIVSALTLHNCDIEYREKVYAEIVRVLKSGGVFINADKYVSDNEDEHSRALEWQLAQFDYFEKVGRPDLKKKWTEHYLQDEDPRLALKEQDYVNDLKTVGFNNIQRIYRKQMEAVYTATT